MSRKPKVARAPPPVQSIIQKRARPVKDGSKHTLAYAVVHIIQKNCNIIHTQFGESDLWFKTRDKIDSQMIASLIASTTGLTMQFYAEDNNEMKCLVDICESKPECEQFDIPLEFDGAMFEGLAVKDIKNARNAITFLHSVALDLPELSTTLTAEPTCYNISIYGYSYIDLCWLNFFVGSFENLIQYYTIGPAEDGLVIEVNMRKVDIPPEYFTNPIPLQQ